MGVTKTKIKKLRVYHDRGNFGKISNIASTVTIVPCKVLYDVPQKTFFLMNFFFDSFSIILSSEKNVPISLREQIIDFIKSCTSNKSLTKEILFLCICSIYLVDIYVILEEKQIHIILSNS